MQYLPILHSHFYSARFAVLLACTFLLRSSLIHAQFATIKNDRFWYTNDGKPINSQGGGIFRFANATGEEKYYWYGVHYAEADSFRNNPTKTFNQCTFEAVTCYSSTDLVHWTFEANVLSKSEVLKDGRNTWVGRLGVAYLPETQQYAMLVQHGYEVLIAVSKQPTGPFTWHRKINMQSMIGTSNTGDQTVFTDETTGKSFLVYSYGKGRNKIYVSEIGVVNGQVGLLDCTKVFEGESREGNCMFQYNGRYYMAASNIYGWDASYAYYLVANDIRGPYTPVNNMQVMKGCEFDYAHVSQTGFFVSIHGSKQTSILYCGDRWANFAGNGLGYNQWVPLSFEDSLPIFNSLHAWDLNASTGVWKVNPLNNYALNPSFEADRKAIPSLVKPVQQQLTGWHSEVLQGNNISLDTSISPILNHANTTAERHMVTGERSLCMSDKTAFERKVYQTISSTYHVPLPNGRYTFSAMVKYSAGIEKLELFATSNQQTYRLPLHSHTETWHKVTLNNVLVKNGQADIGFYIKANALAYCHIDDVAFAQEK